MKTLPSVLVTEKNKLATANPWIVLLDIVLDESTAFYFCSDNSDVTFSGQTYTAFPFDLEPVESSSKGEIPSVSLRVSNVTQLVHYYLEQLNGAVGASVKIRVVNAAYLSEDYAELEMDFSVQTVSATDEWLTFTLGAENPLRRRFPPHRYIAQHCKWNFKSVECAYGGALTTCDRSWTQCTARNNTKRFGGYQGLSEKGWKLV